MVVTDADYQTMFIELTGSTADIIPTSLSQSFMGYQALDLTHGVLSLIRFPTDLVLSMFNR